MILIFNNDKNRKKGFVANGEGTQMERGCKLFNEQIQRKNIKID